MDITLDMPSRAPVARRPSRPDPARVRRIADDEQALQAARDLAPLLRQNALARDRDRALPWDEVDAYSESGLGGITIPRQHGGAQVTAGTLAETIRILSAADPSIAQIPQSQFVLLGRLDISGSPAQQQRFFGAVLAGQRLGNAGPDRRGATAAQVTTRLVRTPQGLRLRGERYYSTGAAFAHWIPSRALDDNGRAVQAWVPHDAPGLSVLDDWTAFGQRTTASGSVLFDDVPVAPENVLPIAGEGEPPNLLGTRSQLVHAAIDLGIAEAAMDDALAFVRERTRPWVDAQVQSAADDPYIIHEVGTLQVRLHAAQELLADAGAAIDDAETRVLTEASVAQASITVAHAKVATAQVALEIAEHLFALAGSSATRAAHGLDRHWRNARVHTLHDPVRWKLHTIGNYLLNGVHPPRDQWN